MSTKKIIGVVLLIAAGVLFYMGYEVSQSVSGQFSKTFSGAESDDAMLRYIGGAVCAVLGFFFVAKK